MKLVKFQKAEVLALLPNIFHTLTCAAQCVNDEETTYRYKKTLHPSSLVAMVTSLSIQVSLCRWKESAA